MIRRRLATAALTFAGAIAYVLFANQFGAIDTALALAVFVGICASGSIAVFYAISPFVYPTVNRGAGVDLMIGVGCGVAILAPIFTGYVLKAG